VIIEGCLANVRSFKCRICEGGGIERDDIMRTRYDLNLEE
jgi:hypothetical protein